MLGESLNNKFLVALGPALHNAFGPALHNALGPERYDTLYDALNRTLRPALSPAYDAPLAQLEQDLENVR